MSEQQMPARIWAGANSSSPQSRYWFDVKPKHSRGTEYTRADISECMVEALTKIRAYAKRNNADADEIYFIADSALSAFKDSAQDRGAS